MEHSGTVEVVASTWHRDSHDLFDYETDQLRTQTFTAVDSVKFARSGSDVQIVPVHQRTAPEAKSSFHLVKRGGQFWVEGVRPSSEKMPWRSIRSLPAGYALSEGDIIKFGRLKLRVRQLVTSTHVDVQPDLSLSGVAPTCCVDSSKSDELEATRCRICLLEGSEEGDPLIAPCACKGSIEYVHLECLRLWIRGRMNLSETATKGFLYRPMACELCKTAYATCISVDSKQMLLAQVPPILAPFVVLESMSSSMEGLHVLSLNALDEKIKFGRGHDCDVRIADVSLSRLHATITFDQGRFILKDNDSKFGTLVKMKTAQQLDVNDPISIQAGRTVYSLSLQ